MCVCRGAGSLSIPSLGSGFRDKTYCLSDGLARLALCSGLHQLMELSPKLLLGRCYF